jgi:dipeptidyl aminopeptidase/acylaminoacyl peptidase
MRRFLALTAFVAATASAQQPFTLQQVLSAPYALSLTASPVGAEFAWVENAEGRRNIWVGGPHEPARQLTHYTEDDAQDIASLTWSPDGKTIAYVYGAEIGASGRPANPAHLQRAMPVEIILQPIDGGDPMHVGEGRSPLFEPLNHHLLFLRGGQTWSADLDVGCSSSNGCKTEIPQSSIHQLLFDRGTPSALTLSPDGKILAYISHRRSHNFLALFNLETKTLTFPAPSTGDDSAPIFSRDGKQLAWLRFPFTDPPEFAGNRTSPNPWSIQILNVATSETRTLFQPEPNKPGSAEPRMSTGEPHLYWTADDKVLFFSEADGWVHLYSVDPSNPKPPTLLTPGGFEVEDATLSPDGTRIVFAANGPGCTCDFPNLEVEQAGKMICENGLCSPGDEIDCNRNICELAARQYRHLWQVILGPGKLQYQQVTVADGIETHPQVSADGVSVATLASDHRYPMHAAIVQADGHPLPIHAAIPATYPAETLVVPAPVHFPSADKLLDIDGQLFLPKAPTSAKHPAILFFHGGPKRQMLLGYPAMDYYSNAYAMNQYLASRGYIVLSVNYRGGIGYGLDFRQCQHCGADGAAEYADVLGAVAYLRSRPDVDTAHIGIWGGSYGGYLTALALARNSDLFAAGVDFHGVHEWAREDNATADWLRGPLANQEKIAALAHASSPMADVDKWRSPVLLIHGDDDPEVAYTQTPMLADALRARNVHVDELIFPDELHGFLLHRDWLTAYEAAANFFDRTLKGKPSSPDNTNSH